MSIVQYQSLEIMESRKLPRSFSSRYISRRIFGSNVKKPTKILTDKDKATRTRINARIKRKR